MARATRQRQAIEHVFRHVGRPLSPEEVLEQARQATSTLGIATVYRHIRVLLDDGWLKAVSIPGGVTRYEVAGKPHHHHFVCRACNRTLDLEGCQLAPLCERHHGHRVESHELFFYGVCVDCSHGSGCGVQAEQSIQMVPHETSERRTMALEQP